jgi:hypothetical protein
LQETFACFQAAFSAFVNFASAVAGMRMMPTSSAAVIVINDLGGTWRMAAPPFGPSFLW